MLESSGEPDLSLETLGAEAGGELGVQDLEGDRAAVLDVMSEKHGGHPPPAEFPFEPVRAGEPVSQPHVEVGQSKPVLRKERGRIQFFPPSNHTGTTGRWEEPTDGGTERGAPRLHPQPPSVENPTRPILMACDRSMC